MMPKSVKPEVPSVQNLFDDLSESAQRLNQFSDTLGKVITQLDAQFQKLNLGIAFWHPICETKDGGRAIGYSKGSGHWGLSIKQYKTEASGYSEEVWLFNNAPRWMRIEAVNLLPELLATGIKRTEEMIILASHATNKVDQILKMIKGETI